MNTKISSSSAWTLSTIERYLTDTALPCRLACVTGDGFPHVSSLWYLYRNGELYFSVQRSTMISRWLSDNPKCGFEVAPNEAPYHGVRGRGVATCMPAADDAILSTLIERFLGDTNASLAGWLLSRTATEVTIRLTPHWLSAWDYGKRMS